MAAVVGIVFVPFLLVSGCLMLVFGPCASDEVDTSEKSTNPAAEYRAEIEHRQPGLIHRAQSSVEGYREFLIHRVDWDTGTVLVKRGEWNKMLPMGKRLVTRYTSIVRGTKTGRTRLEIHDAITNELLAKRTLWTDEIEIYK